jgi:hypothetical protein
VSLESTEAECAANATAPRVSLASMEAKIVARYDLNGIDAARVATSLLTRHPHSCAKAPAPPSVGLLTLCLLVMENGFILVGKSAPASAENFNADLGRKLAYEDAIRQIWPLEGYALRDRLAAA